MDLYGKQALITGATGFIGSRLVKRLALDEGVKVRALVRDPYKAKRLSERGVEVVTGDVTDLASLQSALPGCQVVFHTAAWVSERGTRDEVWAVNVAGTQNLVTASINSGDVKRFVHLSSCAVYGSPQRFNINEQSHTRSRGNLYADSKIAAEEIVFGAYREHGLAAVLARASQVYGPGSKQFTIRPVEVIRSGKMLLIDGGRHLCKPIYIDNLIDGLVLCAQTDAAVGEAINLTDDEPVPWRDFFGAYGRMLGRDSFRSVPFLLAWTIAFFNELTPALKGKQTSLNRKAVQALRSSNSFSNQKARNLLGWQPRVDFSEGMKRTEAWLEAAGYLTDK